MAHRHSARTLFAHPDLRVVDFRCDGVSTPAGGEEIAAHHEIVFVRRGVFERRSGRRSVVADPTGVLFFTRGEGYRVLHGVPGGDECTVVALSDSMLSRLGLRGPGFPAASCRLSGPLHLAHWRLVRSLEREGMEPLEAQERLVCLVGQVVAEAAGSHESSLLPVKPATQRHHRRLARTVVDLLNGEYHERLTLDAIARRVYCSTFHLCQIFRRETGTSIHAHLNQLRLRAAVDRLAQGERDLTLLAHDLGFASRSHFSDAFRRAFRTSPSAVRGDLRPT